jgi:hypothetical protein
MSPFAISLLSPCQLRAASSGSAAVLARAAVLKLKKRLLD